MKQTEKIFTIGELTRRIKGVLETGFVNIAVQGEISNFKHHTSGHCYFTLKDDASQLQAVMWRGRANSLFFTPQDGMKVIARGNITVYEVRGVYQIDVVQLQPLGTGELQLAFERLKSRLAAEGLFDSEHKKPIPQYPEKIGLVTSSTGAAIQDMLNIISRRFPSVELILYPVKVQGEGASDEIAQAIRDFNEYGKVDVLIVGRGGGSIEDLWAFNEEVVARAIYDSTIPVISAVGHEIDYTIADFVADMRAPTPSAAAELVVPNRSELIEFLENFCYTARDRVKMILDAKQNQIRSLLTSYSFNKPLDLLRQHIQHIDELERNLIRLLGHRVTLSQNNLAYLQKRIDSTNPEAVLKRGYTVVFRDDRAVGSSKDLRQNDDINVKFHDGIVPARVN